jgi:hypothetical protein
MVYEAPTLSTVGSVHGLTLGREMPGPKRDNSVWFGYAGPPTHPTPPVGSR